MTVTPTTVRMPVIIPLFVKINGNEFVEIATIEQMVYVTVEVS